MRYDSEGIFWHDVKVEKSGKQSARVRPTPPIPDTGWAPPKDLPNLFHAKVLGIDTETRDPNLKECGPGWGRGDGEIVGISLATDDGHKWYLPIRHTIQPEFNLDPDMVLNYLRDLLKCPMPKVGANILYDIGWLGEENIEVKGLCYDVLYAEAILFDTANDYSLNACATRWLGEQKVDEELYAWSARAYGGKEDRRNQAKNIYRCPPAIVGPYAEADAELPLRILKRQWPHLIKHDLMPIFELETKLIPVLLGMRQRGLPVSIERAEAALVTLGEKKEANQVILDQAAGFEVEIYKRDSLAKLFDKNGLKYPKTKEGNPSFTKDWLAAHDHPIAGMINNCRKYTKAETFVENSIIAKNVDGKIYPSLHPLRGEDGGAVSGRYSASNPNGQQVSARDKELAPLIRGIYVPEPGLPLWIKQDLSQIEYRFFAHYSGDHRLIREYQNPGTDYHEVVSGMLGHMMPRKPVKNFNFMSLYGGGRGKVIHMLKAEFSIDQVEELLLQFLGKIPQGNPFALLADVFIEMYATNFPAAGDSLQRDLQIAESTGEIRTILGRRSTFDLWEPLRRRKAKAYGRVKAVEEYGEAIKRAFCFRALNRRLQGSSADLLKKGMLDAYEQGVFAEIGFPHITVHDELDNSYHPDLAPGFFKLQRCIEQAIQLKVPIMLGAEVGPNWGDVKNVNLEEIKCY